MVADMILDRRVAVDVRADFSKHLVPESADLRVQIPAQRSEVFVQGFHATLPACLDSFATGWTILAATLQLPRVAFWLLGGAALLAGTLDDHFGHVGTHYIKTTPAWKGSCPVPFASQEKAGSKGGSGFICV
jgi:hypothetical protein